MKKIFISIIYSFFCMFLSGCSTGTPILPSLSYQESETMAVQADETMAVQVEETMAVQVEETMAAQADETMAARVDEAMAAYQEFLSTEDWYQLTATDRYPRGDSQAFYAFVDCNGDQVPELHVQGGNIYHIYTFCNQRVELFCELNDWKSYSFLQPLSDGTFLSTERWEHESDGLEFRSSCRTIPQDMKTPVPNEGRDYYCWIILEAENEKIQTQKHYFPVELGKIPEPDQLCSLDNCTATAAGFFDTWQNPELQVKRFLLFPQEEWEYLDALEEGDGRVSFVIEETEHEAWEAFQEILSGDFTQIKELRERSRVAAWYSSHETTGRCIWRYLLMDINHDGHKELLVRYNPDALDYTDFEHSWGSFIVFTYENGWVSAHFLGAFYDSHESFIPLKTGQVVFMASYAGDWDLVVAQIENHHLIPLYSLRKDYQENGETSYYYSQNCTLERQIEAEEISKEEWEEKKGELQKQMLPDDEWFPASVFLPVREAELFLVG